jgi:MFS family permease
MIINDDRTLESTEIKDQTVNNEIGGKPPSLFYAWSVVGMLMLAYTFSFVDRQILSLLVEPLKSDLHLSDTQIGLLQGLAFSLFYTLFGIPIGRMADYRCRKNIIVIGVIFWSVMTAVCGFSKSFASLSLARMGVGVGEATLSPASYSIITDYFPKEKLSTALGVYSLGVYIGAGLALCVGGLLIDMVATIDLSFLPMEFQHQSWRFIFVIVGLPGILLGLILLLFVKEPERRKIDGDISSEQKLSIGDSVKYLLEHKKAFLVIFAGFPLHGIIFYGVLSWLPTYFIREFGWSAGEAGRALGVQLLVFGCAGVIVGGLLCDYLFRKKRADAPFIVALICAFGFGPLIIAGFAFDLSPSLCVFIFGFAIFFGALITGPAPAALQLILPNQLRAQVSALYLLSLNLVGLTLGPLLPALISDYVFESEKMIGVSLAIVAGVASVFLILIFQFGKEGYKSRYMELHG